MKKLFSLTVVVLTFIAFGALVTPVEAQNKCDYTYCAPTTCENGTTAYFAAVTFNATSAVAGYGFCFTPYPTQFVAYFPCTTQRCPVRVANAPEVPGIPNDCDGPATTFAFIGEKEIAVRTPNRAEASKVSRFIEKNYVTLSAETLLRSIKSNFGYDGYYPKRDEHGILIEK